MRIRLAIEMEVELDDSTEEGQEVNDGSITPKEFARRIGGAVNKQMEAEGVDFLWEWNIGYQIMKDDPEIRNFGD